MKDNMFVIRDFCGEEAIHYREMLSVGFHVSMPELSDQEKVIQQLIDETALYEKDKTVLNGNKCTNIGVFQGERLIAAAVKNAFVIQFDGRKCEMLGIGGVVSDPEMRNMGVVRALLLHAFEDMKNNGQIISHMFPFKLAFYRKLGYEVCYSSIIWTIPAEYLPKGKYSGIVRYQGTEEQRLDIRKVYTQFADRYNLAVYKGEERWKRYYERCMPYTSKLFSYLHYTDGEADGFLSYKVKNIDAEPMMIEVQNLYFHNASALRELLIYLGNLQDYANQMRIPMPEDISLTGLLEETCGGYGARNVKREIVEESATRIVDVRKVLEIARYRGEGSVDLRIHDIYCPWNDTCFHIEFDTICKKICEGTRYDAEMDINAFTVFILGSQAFENYEYLKNVNVYGNLENLKKVFYKKNIWCEERF